MPNTGKVVTIELDKERTMVLTYRAAKLFRDTTGKSMGSLQNIEFEEVAALIWACLRKEDPGLTLEAVEEMLYLEKTPYYMEKLMDLFAACNTAVEGEGGKNPESPTG